MSNHSVPATAEGLPRHSAAALIGGAGLPLAVPAMEACAAVASDPCLAFIQQWTGLQEECNRSPEAQDNFYEQHLAPFEQMAVEGIPTATTREGAAAALRKLLSFGDVQGQPQDANLVKAALAFLEGHPA